MVFKLFGTIDQCLIGAAEWGYSEMAILASNKYLFLNPFFPECVARVPVSLWGSGGWGCVRSTLPNRPQPFAKPSATVRVRAILQKRSFLKFQTSRCLVSRCSCGTSWHSDVFCNVSKVVSCGRRNTFATFSQDELQFSWQAQHFGRVQRHFAWQWQHLTSVVSCCVFLRIALSGLRQVATRCKFRGRCGILWDVVKIEGSLTQNIDFKVANLEVPKKIRRKTSILKLQSVKNGGCLAQNARFDAPTCLVSSLWFSCGLAVSIEEAAKPFLFEGAKAGGNVVLRGQARHFVTLQPVW